MTATPQTSHEPCPGLMDLFIGNCRRQPDKAAVVCGEQTFTYAQLADRAARYGGMLRDMGVGSGDVVLVLLDNGIDFSALLLAGADLGLLLAPIATSSSPAGISSAIAATHAHAIVGARPPIARWLQASPGPAIDPEHILVVGRAIEGCRHRDELGAVSPESNALGANPAEPEQGYILTMTSGSTGAPKPITLSQRTKVERSLAGARDLYGLGSDDVIITSSPMYHSLGTRMALLPLLIGATSVILPRYSHATWLQAVEQHRVTFGIMVSNQLEQLQQKLGDAAADISSLRTLVSSSALLKPDVKQACIDTFRCDFHECYGASEVGIVTSLAPQDARQCVASVGKALPYVELVICDEQGNRLPPGERGEICCRTRTDFSGYYRNAEATEAARRGGYFHTGDIGYLDDAGFLYLCGRQKDVIIVGGTNVFPEDVEAALQDQSGVTECAVIGVDDAHFGEAVLAVIVPDPASPPDERRLRGAMAEALADYQQPMAYEFVDQLPRSALGKLMRHQLRERFKDYDATAAIRGMLG